MPAEALAATAAAAEEVLWAPPPRGYSAMNVSSVLLLLLDPGHHSALSNHGDIFFQGASEHSEFSIFLL